MATLDKLMQDVTQQLKQQSVSWGSLILLVSGLGVMIAMMVMYSHQPLTTF